MITLVFGGRFNLWPKGAFHVVFVMPKINLTNLFHPTFWQTLCQVMLSHIITNKILGSV